MMGIKNIEIATKAEFDISVSASDFKLPDFPIYNIDGEKLDKNKLDAMDKQSEIKFKKDIKDMAQVKASIEAAKKSAGIKDGEKITKEQEKKMGNAMMKAMWPQIKKKILLEGKILRFSRKCLNNANTLKDANICVDKANTMGGEHEESFEEWSLASKKKILGFMEQSIKSMECMEKTNNMKEMQQCIPAQ
jgi:lipoprotein NlpI